MSKLTLGKEFRNWFTIKLPEAFSYRESTKIVTRRDPWQHAIAYGLYGKFRTYMKNKGFLHHCPSSNTLKNLYYNGKGSEEEFED